MKHRINIFYVQAEVVRACKSRFDEQLSRVYTRALYNEYKREYARNMLTAQLL
jgi:hypothetical protein